MKEAEELYALRLLMINGILLLFYGYLYGFCYEQAEDQLSEVKGNERKNAYLHGIE